MKTGIMFVAGLLCMTTAVYAGQGPKKDSFWDKLQNKFEKLVPAKKGATTTAVGGVRGAKNDDAADIYWKGKDKTVEMSDEEHQKFNLAVESKLKGDNELALKHFEEFLVLYPQSNFRVEGLQAAEKIRTEIAATKAPARVEGAQQPAARTEPASQPAAAVEPVQQPAAVPERTPEPAAEAQPAR